MFAKDCVHKGRRSSPFVAMPVYFGCMCFSVFSVAAIRPDTLRDASGSICSVFVSIQHFIIVIFQWSLVAFYPDCFNQHLCSVLALLCLLPSCLFKHHWIFSSEIFMLIASVTSGIHSKRKAGIQFNGSEEECAEGGNISFSLGDAAQGTRALPSVTSWWPRPALDFNGFVKRLIKPKRCVVMGREFTVLAFMW